MRGDRATAKQGEMCKSTILQGSFPSDASRDEFARTIHENGTAFLQRSTATSAGNVLERFCLKLSQIARRRSKENKQ